MKNIRTRALVLMLLVVLLLGSCEFLDSFIRPLPPIIELYNSALQKTLKLLPNDTLYVKVSGLAPTTWYDIEIRRPNRDMEARYEVNSAILVESDADGVIQPTPAWYDIGLKWDPDANGGAGGLRLASEADLGLAAFEVHVKTHSESASISRAAETGTDFGLEFFIVYNTQADRPQPIVMAGEQVGGVFNLENALDVGDTLYVKVANMTNLPPNVNSATLYVVPFSGQNYEDGSSIGSADQLIITKTVNFGTSDWTALTDINGNGLQIPWSNSSNTIPSSAQNNAFSVFLDVNNNGFYDVTQQGMPTYYLDGVDGNGVAGFIVRPPYVPPTADTMSLNLVSGGIFTYNWSTYQYDYDYRDSYRRDGIDTKIAYYYGVGPGVKVIWNPYAYYNGWNNDPTGGGLYYGRWIDLYIIKSGGTSTGWTKGTNLNDPSGILVRKLRLPVQYGCSNGLNQQTIWPAPAIPGYYALVLDMDGNGEISDYDIVDDLHRNGDDWVVSGTNSSVDGTRAGFQILQ